MTNSKESNGNYDGDVIKKEIEEYTDDIIKKNIRTQPKTCSNSFCNILTPLFTFHQCRARIFKFTVSFVVQMYSSVITSWKCVACGKFTSYYPSFAAPLKQYTIPEMQFRSEKYLKDKDVSYRTVVSNNNSGRIRYGNKQTGKPDDRELAHTTVFRWLPFFTKEEESFSFSKTILKLDESNDIYKRPYIVFDNKYQSEKKHAILKRVTKYFYLYEMIKTFKINKKINRDATEPPNM